MNLQIAFVEASIDSYSISMSRSFSFFLPLLGEVKADTISIVRRLKAVKKEESPPYEIAQIGYCFTGTICLFP
jgi:hypothetical protein